MRAFTSFILLNLLYSFRMRLDDTLDIIFVFSYNK